MRQQLERLARAVDRVTESIGRLTSWLTVPVIGALFIAVPLRYIFHYGSTYLDDWPQMGHSALFLVGAAYALFSNDHVRVDIVYKTMSVRRRAAVDLFGTLVFLLPWLAVIGWYVWPVVKNSWRVHEAFPETMTPGYFLSKSLVLVFAASVGLQALANVARSVLALTAPADHRR